MKSTSSINGWQKTDPDVFWGEIAPCDHLLQIYEDDTDFIDTLEGFVSGGLGTGDSVIVIATEQHLTALNARLRAKRHNIFSLTLKDQYIPLSADDTLSRFMINGWPDENLFYYELTNLLLRARKGGHHVRAFGEMVAVLWSQGLIGATVHLEHLWSRFCESEQFSLLCAYPKSGFTDDAHESLLKICQCHSKMISGAQKGGTGMLVRDVATQKTGTQIR